MKKRKGYRNININGREFQWKVSATMLTIRDSEKAECILRSQFLDGHFEKLTITPGIVADYIRGYSKETILRHQDERNNIYRDDNEY